METEEKCVYCGRKATHVLMIPRHMDPEDSQSTIVGYQEIHLCSHCYYEFLISHRNYLLWVVAFFVVVWAVLLFVGLVQSGYFD